jgi:hypothetical protein
MFCYKKPFRETLETPKTDHTYETREVAKITFREK